MSESKWTPFKKGLLLGSITGVVTLLIFLILGSWFFHLTPEVKKKEPMGTYFECAYPYMGGGIYLPCTTKQRERNV